MGWDVKWGRGCQCECRCECRRRRCGAGVIYVQAKGLNAELEEDWGLTLGRPLRSTFIERSVKIQRKPPFPGIECHRADENARTLDFGFGLSLTRPTVPDVGRGHTQDGLAPRLCPVRLGPSTLPKTLSKQSFCRIKKQKTFAGVVS